MGGPARRWKLRNRPLDGMEPAVTTSSPRIVLAEGSISHSDRMAIELLDARETPKMIMIRWPAQATPVQPEAYADCASKIMRLFAKASVELARIRARRLTKINRGRPQVVTRVASRYPRRISHICLHADVCDVLDLNCGLCQFRVAGWLVRAGEPYRRADNTRSPRLVCDSNR
jgi:hypothetical protein